MKPEEIIAWRKRLGLRQSDAARIMGTSPRTWSSMETGDHPVMYPRMLRLAMAFVELDAAGQLDDGQTLLIESMENVSGSVPESVSSL